MEKNGYTENNIKRIFKKKYIPGRINCRKLAGCLIKTLGGFTK
jgi:hypothetical protein